MAAALHVDSTEREVSCLVRGTLSGLVYTGHEGRVRIWRHGTGPEALVTASTIHCDRDDEVTHVTEIGENAIAISVGRSVLVYDTNKDPPNTPSQRFLNCTKEEINHLSVNSGVEFMSACDDSGDVVILDIKRRGVFKRCSGHDNICSCALFNPRRQWEIVSGGLDCRLIAWDYSKGKVTASMDMTRVEPPATPPSSYSVNPPMVHALCFIRDSPILAAGLGNGKVVLVNLARRNKLDVLSVVSMHSSSVNTIECAILRTTPIQEGKDAACKPSDKEFEQQVLLSGGNDAKIVMATLTTNSAPGVIAGKRAHKPRITGIEQVRVIEHGSKINFICSDGNKFYIADLTNKITVYDHSK